MKTIKIAKWMSGYDNKNFARLLIGYDDGTYEEVKVKLNGNSSIRYYYWFDGDLEDPFPGIYNDINSRTFKNYFNIQTIIGMNKTNGYKKIKELEESWKKYVENGLASYDKAKEKEKEYYRNWHCSSEEKKEFWKEYYEQYQKTLNEGS